MRLSYVAVTIALLLWGAFFIEIGAPLALGLLLAIGLIYASIAKNFEIDTIGVLVLANILYWLVSGFVVDALDLSTFADRKFYGGEGRIFISLVPLLALAFAFVGTWEFKATIWNLYAVAISSVVIYAIWLVTHTSLLSGPGHADEFHGFLSSHTGSGTFFGSIAVFMILYSAERRSTKPLVFSFLLLGPVLSSGSREALVGVMAALLWYWFMKRLHPKVLIAVALVILSLVPATSMMSNKTYNRTIGILNVETVESMISQAKAGIRSDWAVGDWSPNTDTENLESGDVTTLVRIMLWVYASKRVVDSPLFGMGWGRFNDKDLVMLEAGPILAVAAQGEKVFSTANAHNSYFQLLAESGILGLFLYLAVWIALFRRCYKAEKIFFPVQSARAYYVACQGLTIYILSCALTGHALASPSVMVPVVTILGVGMAYYRSVLKIKVPAAQ